MAGEALTIGEIAAVVVVKDAFSEVLGKLKEQFEEIAGPVATQVVAAMAAIAAAVAAVVTSVVELGERGSNVADVGESFERLGTQISNADEILSQMRDGVKGTVSDYQLMIDANHLISAGAVQTADDLGTVTAAARVLAKQYGGEMQDSIQAVSRALETGRIGRLALQGVVVDTAKAEQAFAAANGVEADELSKATLKAVDRQAVLDALRAKIASAGEQELDFKEKIEQGWTALSNFTDQLARAVAESPVLATALDAIKGSLQAAFGTTQAEAIKTIVGIINDLAIKVVSLSQFVVSAGAVMYDAWSGLKILWGILQMGLLQIEDALLRVNIAAVQARAFIEPWNDYSKAIADLKQHLAEVDQSMQDTTTDINAQVQASAEVRDKAEQWNTSLEGLKQKMIAASQETAKGTEEVTKHGEAHQASAPKVELNAAAIKKWNDAMKELNSVGSGFRETLAQMDGEVVEAIRYYRDAGVGVDTLVTLYGKWNGVTKSQVAAIDELRKADADTAKQMQGSIEATSKMWAEYDDARVKNGGTAYDQQVSAIKKWATEVAASTAAAKKDSIEFYVALQATVEEKINAISVDWRALSENSRAAVEQAATKAENTFQKALENVGQYTQEQIDKFQELSIKARSAADNWGQAVEENGKKAADAIDSVTEAHKALVVQLGAGQSQDALNRANDIQMGTVDAYSKAGIFTGLSIGGSGLTGFGLTARAEGGPVASGMPYMVGEQGPEMFVPKESGSIVPNGAGGGGVVININGSVLGDPEKIARAVGDAVERRLRVTGTRLPSKV